MCICRGQAHLCLGTMAGPLRRGSADLSSALLVRSKHGRPRGLRCRLPRRRRAINWVTTAARGPGCTRQAAARRRLAHHREGGAAWQHVVEGSLVRRSVEQHVPRPTLLLDLGFWHVRRRLRDAFCHGGRSMLAGRVCSVPAGHGHRAGSKRHRHGLPTTALESVLAASAAISLSTIVKHLCGKQACSLTPMAALPSASRRSSCSSRCFTASGGSVRWP